MPWDVALIIITAVVTSAGTLLVTLVAQRASARESRRDAQADRMSDRHLDQKRELYVRALVLMDNYRKGVYPANDATLLREVTLYDLEVAHELYLVVAAILAKKTEKQLAGDLSPVSRSDVNTVPLMEMMRRSLHLPGALESQLRAAELNLLEYGEVRLKG